MRNNDVLCGLEFAPLTCSLATDHDEPEMKRIVIVGGGYSGFHTALGLEADLERPVKSSRHLLPDPAIRK